MDSNDNIIAGKNPVFEAINAGRTIDKIYIKKGERSLGKIIALAKEKKIPVATVPLEKLSEMYKGNHQGVIAKSAAKDYVSLDEILNYAKEKNEPPFIVICDRITDPHNLGAIIRSANASGAHGVVIARHEASGLSPIVDKTSAGALEHTKIAKAANISKTIETLKKEGLWVAGASGEGKPMYDCDLKGPLAIVIGNEGDGLARLVSESCDFLVSIPMFGQTESLNASCAAAVLLYEAVRQRH